MCRTAEPLAGLSVLLGGAIDRRGAAMNANVTVLERAFELARSGRCRTIDDIHRQLKAEGYSTHQIMGPWLHRQLRSLMQDANSRAAGGRDVASADRH